MRKGLLVARRAGIAPAAVTIFLGQTTPPAGNNSAVATGAIQATLFTASKTGTVGHIFARSGATTNTCTSLILGIYADNGSGTAPIVNAAAIGQATYSGTPPTNTWVSVSGVSIAVVSGTIYWIAFLPQGGTFNLKFTTASGGTKIVVASGTQNNTSLASLAGLGRSWNTVGAFGPYGLYGGV